jgi:hypothetical protein
MQSKMRAVDKIKGRIIALPILAICIYAFGCTINILASVTVAQSATLQPDELAASQRFNREFDEQLVRNDIFFQTSQVKTIWNILDETTVRLLNAGHSSDGINRFFTTLRGFEAPTNEPTIIGNAVFYSKPAHELSTYGVSPSRENSRYLFGIFNYGRNGRGRLSVYAKRENRWVRTAHFDADSLSSVYELPVVEGALPLITVQKVIGGDHDDGVLNAWWLKKGRLFPEKLTTDRFMDLETEQVNGVVNGYYSRSPGLYEAFLGERIRYLLKIDVVQRHIRFTRTVLNPWLEVVSEFYDYLEAKNSPKAKQLLASESIAKDLTFDSPRLFRSDGDLNHGAGFVVLEKYSPDDGRHEYLRVESRRNSANQWKITAVTKIERP